MQLRVAGAARAMPEAGGDEAGAVEPACAPLLERRRLRPSVVRAASNEARLALQPRERLARRRRRLPRSTSARTSGSPNAYSTDTDFGAENVRSNPGTRPLNGRIWVPFGDSPVPGTSPARIARRSSPVTASGRFEDRRARCRASDPRTRRRRCSSRRCRARPATGSRPRRPRGASTTTTRRHPNAPSGSRRVTPERAVQHLWCICVEGGELIWMRVRVGSLGLVVSGGAGGSGCCRGGRVRWWRWMVLGWLTGGVHQVRVSLIR